MENFFQKNNKTRVFFTNSIAIHFFYIKYCVISKKMYFCKAFEKHLQNS